MSVIDHFLGKEQLDSLFVVKANLFKQKSHLSMIKILSHKTSTGKCNNIVKNFFCNI